MHDSPCRLPPPAKITPVSAKEGHFHERTTNLFFSFTCTCALPLLVGLLGFKVLGIDDRSEIQSQVVTEQIESGIVHQRIIHEQIVLHGAFGRVLQEAAPCGCARSNRKDIVVGRGTKVSPQTTNSTEVGFYSRKNVGARKSVGFAGVGDCGEKGSERQTKQAPKCNIKASYLKNLG